MNESSDFRKKPGRPRKAPTNEKLKSLYADHTSREIAKMYDTDSETVRQWAKRARKEGTAIPYRNSGQPRKRPDDADLMALYKTQTAAELAAILNTTPGTIRTWVSNARKRNRDKEML